MLFLFPLFHYNIMYLYMILKDLFSCSVLLLHGENCLYTKGTQVIVNGRRYQPASSALLRCLIDSIT